MYYTEINGKQEGFKQKKVRDLISKIATNARQHKRVRILYYKKTNRRLVHRDVAAYSYKEGYLYVTDTRSGTKKIRGYDIGSIRAVSALKTKFKPMWEVTL